MKYKTIACASGLLMTIGGIASKDAVWGYTCIGIGAIGCSYVGAIADEQSEKAKE